MSRPLSGALALLTLLVTWLALASGSLLTTLAVWALFDLLWGAAGLIYGSVGERMTFGWTLNGAASLILWTVFLLLEQQGGSTLWWLMWPSPAVVSLLAGAALLRVGVYPWHIAQPRRLGELDALMLVSSLSPVLGLGLLYRVQNLPGLVTLPSWVLVVGVLSLFWGSLRAWLTRRSNVRSLWMMYGLLGVLIAGATRPATAPLVLRGSLVWFGGWVLFHLTRRYDATAPYWAWPGWMGLFFVLGVLPSAMGSLLIAALAGLGWVGRVFLVLGWGALGSATLRTFADKLRDAASVNITPAWPWQRLALGVALCMALLGLLFGTTVIAPSTVGLLLWLGSLLLAVITYRWGAALIERALRRTRPLWDLLDVQWFHRSIWAGLEHILGFVRVLAEVVEGSGALLWSMLVVLILLLIRGSQ
jgi:hypothetical protein